MLFPYVSRRQANRLSALCLPSIVALAGCATTDDLDQSGPAPNTNVGGSSGQAGSAQGGSGAVSQGGSSGSTSGGSTNGGSMNGGSAGNGATAGSGATGTGAQGGSSAGGQGGSSGSTGTGATGGVPSGGAGGSSGMAAGGMAAGGSTAGSSTGGAGTGGAGSGGTGTGGMASGGMGTGGSVGGAGVGGMGAGGTGGSGGMPGGTGGMGTGGSGGGATSDSCPGAVVAMTGTGSAPRVGTVNDDTNGATDAIGAPSCRSSDGPEHVWVFNADTDGIFQFSVDPASGFDAILSVRTDCSTSSSDVGCADSPGAGGVENVVFWADAGTSYYAIVDGYSNDTGAYSLTGTLTPESANEDCPGETVTLSGSNPASFSVSGDTSNRWPNHTGSCRSSTSKDAVYAVTAPADGALVVTLDPGSGYDAVLYMRTSCDQSGSQVACVDGPGSGGVESFTQQVSAGSTYYVFVDGYQAGNEGSYTLDIDFYDEPEANQCDGELITFTGNTASLSASTAAPGVTANYSSTCGNAGSAPDLVYRFVAPQTGTLTVTADPESGFDLVAYARTTCAGGGELGCRDQGGSGSAETATLATTMGETYFIIVDGYSGDSGAFDLTLSY